MKSNFIEWGLILFFGSFLLLSGVAKSSSSAHESDEAMLTKKILDGYEKTVRPIDMDTNKTVINFGITLSQIISVSEKNEELSTSVYLYTSWTDKRLTWDMEKHNNINILRIPADDLWVPNIILENSKDGEFEPSLRVRTLVYHDGTIEWMPPALYKSFCRIEVSLFPFDWQNCSLVFRSMDYGADDLDLVSIYDNLELDPKAFQPNGEWDLIQKPIKSLVTKRGGIEYADVVFYFILQRRPQFYIMNLIAPCILMSMFSCFTFILPPISGEKMTLSVSVLLGETVFLFLIAQRMPETSLSVPLIGLYLIFSMFLIVICVIFSVIVNNINYRTSTSHNMPKWAKTVIMDKLGPLLGVERPPPSSPWQIAMQRRRDRIKAAKEKEMKNRSTWRSPSEMLFDSKAKSYGFRERHNRDKSGFTSVTPAENGEIDPTKIPAALLPVPEKLRPMIEGVNYIADRTKKTEIKEQACDDWTFLAQILDRFFFWIYLAAFILGSLGFFLRVNFAYYPEPEPLFAG